ncbi:hypothetical protein BOTBODRAFT_262740 [Botryobasidium botryosum FD-172 SS1]|uniref:Uncharacterized protein n=1 Tax=Botryobasidium botryosum (strain FD-172 SS1) TaxID=930990 RepID=A0A067LSL1_BOTB1|nr:hypothetical protein BOTBODRAFT_262740 [Botryobasidium botryosum FD-172 SS1]
MRRCSIRVLESNNHHGATIMIRGVNTNSPPSRCIDDDPSRTRKPNPIGPSICLPLVTARLAFSIAGPRYTPHSLREQTTRPAVAFCSHLRAAAHVACTPSSVSYCWAVHIAICALQAFPMEHLSTPRPHPSVWLPNIIHSLAPFAHLEFWRSLGSRKPLIS